MNHEAYNLIIDTISKLLEAKNFQAVDLEDGSYFTDQKAAVRVRYDEGKELFYLEQTTVTDGTPSQDWKTLSSWLFGKDYPVKEAKSIANDFEDTLREFLGVKPTTVKNTAANLPAKANPGDDVTPATLAGRFLTIFPQFKGEYEKYLTENETFLYVHFFEEIAVPHLVALLDANDKKRLEKYFAMLNHTYSNGNKDARAVVGAVILSGALRDTSRMETATKYMEEYPFLKTAAQFAVKVKKK